MSKEDIINFYLWQKMSSKGNLWNLFWDFLNKEVEKDKKDILEMWKQIEDLLDQINKKLI